jgi:hypothetical protein
MKNGFVILTVILGFIAVLVCIGYKLFSTYDKK